MPRRLPAFVLLATLAVSLAGATVPLARDEPAAPPATANGVLDRVVLIGASATAGFGAAVTVEGEGKSFRASVDLDDAFGLTLRQADGLKGQGDLMFFMNPGRVGPMLIKRAKRADPTLLVGVDFLFWYGYGNVEHDGSPEGEQAARLARLEQGFELLEAFSCPIIVGDFPDMSPAIGLMISRSQMPSEPSLRALNERVGAWVGEQDDRVLFPLADLVTRMRSGDELIIGPTTWPAGASRRLIQDDQLHPTAEGLVALSQMIADLAITRFDDAKADDFDLDAGRVLEALRAKALAEAEAREKRRLERLRGAG